MSEPEVATLKQFAEILGVRPSYVTKLKQAGRLVLTEDGRVLVEASRRRIEETRDVRHEGVRRRWARERAARAADEAEAPESAPTDDWAEPLEGTTAYWQRREAAARAQLREIELAEREGRLVDADTVRRAGEELGAFIRARLEALPDQIAPLLVGIGEESKTHTLLADHMETVLTDIANKLASLAELRSEPKGETK